MASGRCPLSSFPIGQWARYPVPGWWSQFPCTIQLGLGLYQRYTGWIHQTPPERGERICFLPILSHDFVPAVIPSPRAHLLSTCSSPRPRVEAHLPPLHGLFHGHVPLFSLGLGVFPPFLGNLPVGFVCRGPLRTSPRQFQLLDVPKRRPSLQQGQQCSPLSSLGLGSLPIRFHLAVPPAGLVHLADAPQVSRACSLVLTCSDREPVPCPSAVLGLFLLLPALRF